MPGAHHGYYMRAREREQWLLAVLTEAQEKGEPTPTAATLAKICGWQTRKGVHQAIGRLVDAGAIIKHPYCDPIVQIGFDRDKPAIGHQRRPVLHFFDVAARMAAVTRDDLIRTNRTRLYSRPRTVAFHFARQEGWTLARVAREAQRDHTSVIYACNKVEKLLLTDPLFARLYRRTEAALQGEQPAPLVKFTPASPKKPVRFELGDAGEFEPVAPRKHTPDRLLAALQREGFAA